MQAVRSKAELQNHKNKVIGLCGGTTAWINRSVSLLVQPLCPAHTCADRFLQLANSYHELLEEFSTKELRSVGNYTLGKLIGKGSFGKVYLATHKLTNGSKVVLKSANKDDANLAREIHHHRQFLHPHIARLYEVIVTENLVWLVLEYCPGDELYNYLCNNGPLPAEQVQKIFTQLVGAVTYVHNLSCVHRDLKLENILLDKHGDVKLVDFGFTREYEGKSSHLQTFCGTVCYSAPEMLKGEKYAGEKVDVWSLGIILYALLAGELPWDDDDDVATKHKILSSDPIYPDTFSPEAKSLISQLLSKRPIMRPTLADILAHPFLSPYAPAQQAILKVTRPAPFTTPLEKDTLQRMRSAGIDIDTVIEHVLAQRCDALAGWWALLIEKEERKERRRERKRREKEQEIKNLRRISAASSRLTPTLQDVDEENTDTQVTRGRLERRSFPTPQFIIEEMPQLPEGTSVQTSGTHTPPPPPIEKDVVRSVSSSRHRPALPPKEPQRRRSRSSTLQLTNPELLAPPGTNKRRNVRRHNVILNQLASIKHWFVESAKRARSPGIKADGSPLRLTASRSPNQQRKPLNDIESRNVPNIATMTIAPSKTAQNTPRAARYANPRSSISPAPLTPRSSVYRRSSAGLRGRKSTSSSVSSIRSIHHVHTHSKTSSTSSNTNSVQSSALGAKALPHPRSPHSSVKVLPATPTSGAFPNNIRVSRSSPAPINTSAATFDDRSFSGPMPSPGLVFAKRRKTPFRGPQLHINSNVGGSSSRSREGSVGRRSGSLSRRKGVPMVAEEDEEDIEEVEAFSPITTDAEETFMEGQEITGAHHENNKTANGPLSMQS